MNRVMHSWERHQSALPCTESDAAVVKIFEQFWLCRGAALLAEARRRGGDDLPLDYSKLITSIKHEVYDIETTLQAQPARVLLQLGVAAELSIAKANADQNGGRGAPPKGPTRIQLEHVMPELGLGQLRSATIGRLVSVRATVTRVSAIKPLVVSACFSCAKCGLDAGDAAMRSRFDEGRYEPPARCASESCKARSFELVRSSAATVDYQKIKVQQQIDDADEDTTKKEDDIGRVPRSLDVELVGASMVDKCVPGDVVVIGGVVKSIQTDVQAGRHDKRALSRSVFVLYLDANSMVNLTKETNNDGEAPDEENSNGNELSQRDVERIRAIAASEDCLSHLVNSLSPSIFGHELVKLGLLLGIFGGSSDAATTSTTAEEEEQGPVLEDNGQKPKSRGAVSVRSNSHVLVVGDPGLGKSQLLRAAAAVAPRAVYVCGNTTTTTGLTVSISRDGPNGGASALEAGALVLADRGACCIDEFDKMDPGQHAGLLEAMEQQQISIAKSGVVASLSARTAVLAAANPIGGQYDRARTVSENIKLSAPLLSRFDLIFILVDDAHRDQDALLSKHVVQMHSTSRGAGSVGRRHFPAPNEGGESLQSRLLNQGKVIPRQLLRKYITYARQSCQPRLSRSAAKLLQKTYLEMRQRVANSPHSSMPITMRQLESLVRLAQSRAKMELAPLVSAEHARDVIDLMKAAIADACTTQTGALDFSRATTGMSASKLLKALVTCLTANADKKREPWFSIEDVENIVTTHKLKSTKATFEMIEMLRDQNYVLYQPHMNKDAPYRLASSKYADSTSQAMPRASQR